MHNNERNKIHYNNLHIITRIVTRSQFYKTSYIDRLKKLPTSNLNPSNNNPKTMLPSNNGSNIQFNLLIQFHRNKIQTNDILITKKD